MQLSEKSMQFKLANGSTSLFGYLVTTSAFTPAANGESFQIRLRAMGL